VKNASLKSATPWNTLKSKYISTHTSVAKFYSELEFISARSNKVTSHTIKSNRAGLVEQTRQINTVDTESKRESAE